MPDLLSNYNPSLPNLHAARGKLLSASLLCFSLLLQPATFAPVAFAIDSFDKVYQNASQDLAKGYARSAITGFTTCLKLHPNDPASSLGLALALKKNGEAAKSIPLFRQVIESDPNNPQALFELAEILSWDQNKRGEAIYLLRKLLENHPEHMQGHLFLGKIASWTRETHDDAIKHLGIVVEHNPNDVQSLLTLAQINNWRANYPEAERLYRLYLAKKADDSTTRLELAKILSYQPESRQEAIKQFDIYIAKNPNDLTTRLARAMTLAWTGDYKKALPELRSMATKSPFEVSLPSIDPSRNNVPAILALAQVLSWSKNFPEAESAYQTYLDRQTNDWGALAELAAILSYQPARRIEALALFDKALELNPRDKIIRLNRAHTLRWIAKHEEAISEFRTLLQDSPNDAEIEKALGLTLYDQQNPSEAMIHLQKASQLKPNDFEIQKWQALCLLKAKRIGEAETSLQALLQKSPSDPDLNFGMAQILASQDKNDQALEYLQKGLSSAIKTEDRIRLAQELTGQLKHRSLAIKVCEQMLKENPQDADALLLLGKIQSWDDESRSQALSNLEKYVAMKPDDKEAKAYYAQVLSWTKKRRMSLKMYDDMLHEFPNDRLLLIRHAQVLSWTGHIGKAMKEYRQVLKGDPYNRDALIGLGQCTSWQGDFFRAEKIFSKAREKYNEDMELLIEQALNYKQMGRMDKAVKLVKICMQMINQTQAP